MWVLIVGPVLLAIAAMIAGYIRNKRLQKKIDSEELDSFLEVKEVGVECYGQHGVCKRDGLLAAINKQTEYYDDEELGTFIGRALEGYTPEEADKFHDALYTMQDTDAAGWIRSLQLREVSLPDEIEDEVFLVIDERRIYP